MNVLFLAFVTFNNLGLMMHIRHTIELVVAGVVSVCATSSINSTLASLCTVEHAKAKLPLDAYQGITIDASSVTAQAYYNYSVTGSVMYPDTGSFDYCNVTFAYTHDGVDDQVLVTYWFPTAAQFQNRFLATGGGGLDINSGSQSVAGGVPYGAVSGLTDGGFGGFSNAFDSVFPLANGSANWNAVYDFGYLSIREMTVLGKAYAASFYNTANSTKVYTYYQGCSEGGREGWSQVQRYADAYDGAVIGAPAFRYSFQQVNHLTSNIVEKTIGYYPPPCELSAILNLTIAACDSLDGKTDGVVARNDLCQRYFDLSSTIGSPYSCAATSGGPGSMKPRQMQGGSTTPAQNGTISAKAVEVAKTILAGLHDSNGDRVYLSYTMSSTYTDAQTTFNSTTNTWGLDVNSLGGEWIKRFLQLQNSSDIGTLDGVTYDTLKAWIIQGYQMYSDSLQVSWPDLTPYHQHGGKVLHYHGESDSSIPAGSSVIYHEAVRKAMYGHLSYNASNAALNEWYKLFVVPGASHCSTNALEPNGPWPQTNLQVMIDWVEKGTEPVTLNATHLAGDDEGQNAQICAWPLLPLWTHNGTVFECVYDQSGIDTWLLDFPGVPAPLRAVSF